MPAQYCEEMPEFALRLQAKAGLTGYAQVYGKYNTTPYDKLQMDLMYIAHPSLVEDLKIILATVKILFMPESTEGVSEGQNYGYEWRKSLNIDDFAHSKLLKIGRNSRVESGINAPLTVALSWETCKMPCIKLK